MILDCHVHLNSPDGTAEPLADRVAALQAEMDRFGVDRALVLTSFLASSRRPSVEEVVDAVRDDPRLSVVEGVSLYGKARFSLSAIEERLRRQEIVGLKLYPGYEHYYPSDRICDPLYELAAKHGVPVMIHTGDCHHPRAKVKYAHPLHVDEVAVDHPDVSLVICHLGNPWFRDTAEILYKNPNVYADISGLVLGDVAEPFETWLRAQFVDILQLAGDPDKILYGTDWPIVNMGPYLRLVDRLDLPPSDREKILWGNAARVFGLPARAEPPRAAPS